MSVVQRLPLEQAEEDRAQRKELSHADALRAVTERLTHQRILSKVPLFILGAGISNKRVPSLADIGWWLHQRLAELSEEIVDRDRWIMDHASRLVDEDASRRQASELFSALQKTVEPFYSIWNDFSSGFLLDGLDLDPSGWPSRFPGLCSGEVEPTDAHWALATLLQQSEAYVMSLNFDGLTYWALTACGKAGVALHSERQIRDYFAADVKERLPAVIKIRGDVFSAQCEGTACPSAHESYPLDRFRGPQDRTLMCPVCKQARLRLQFYFPGSRAKEEAAASMLWEVRRFLGNRLSALIIVGLSGRWDRYLLRFLFDFAKERGLLVVDVKPPDKRCGALIDDFRRLYYPSIPSMTDVSDSLRTQGACFVRIEAKANDFIPRIAALPIPAQGGSH
jgi:NAD-dependent SIR2 family protein deacetylase